MIYFIQEGEAGPIKIGYTNSIKGRLASLQCGNHRQLHVLTWIKGTKKKEQELHSRFRDLRIAGEWFNPDPAILDYIEHAAARLKKPRAHKAKTTRPRVNPVKLLTPIEAVVRNKRLFHHLENR